jgi:hypothetical protein
VVVHVRPGIVTERVVIGEVAVVDMPMVAGVVVGPVVLVERIMHRIDVRQIAVGKVEMGQVLVQQPGMCEIDMRETRMRGVVVPEIVLDARVLIVCGVVIDGVATDMLDLLERDLTQHMELVAVHGPAVQRVALADVVMVGRQVGGVRAHPARMMRIQIDVVTEISLSGPEVPGIQTEHVRISSVGRHPVRVGRGSTEHRMMEVGEIVMITGGVMQRVAVVVVHVLPGDVIVVEAVEPDLVKVNVHEMVESVEGVHVRRETRGKGVGSVTQGLGDVVRLEPGKAVRAQVGVGIRQVRVLGQRLFAEMFD